MNRQQVTREEALLHLHDRLGRRVEVTVEIDRGSYGAAMVVAAHGVLRYLQQGEFGWGEAQQDMIGFYRLDSEEEEPERDADTSTDKAVSKSSKHMIASTAIVDLSELDGGWLVAAREGEPPHSLAFELAEDVTLTVEWGGTHKLPARR